MKKSLILLMLTFVLAGCGFLEPEEIIREVQVTRQVEVTREVEIIEQVEVIKEVEVEVTRQVEVTRIVELEPNELGPWTKQETITKNGQYLVPEEMQPGQWAYTAMNPDDTCWATTHSDLSGELSSVISHYYSENKGFFVLRENVRMVELIFGPCEWTRIGD